LTVLIDISDSNTTVRKEPNLQPVRPNPYIIISA